VCASRGCCACGHSGLSSQRVVPSACQVSTVEFYVIFHLLLLAILFPSNFDFIFSFLSTALLSLVLTAQIFGLLLRLARVLFPLLFQAILVPLLCSERARRACAPLTVLLACVSDTRGYAVLFLPHTHSAQPAMLGACSARMCAPNSASCLRLGYSRLCCFISSANKFRPACYARICAASDAFCLPAHMLVFMLFISPSQLFSQACYARSVQGVCYDT
jgi:hypothetical protein